MMTWDPESSKDRGIWFLWKSDVACLWFKARCAMAQAVSCRTLTMKAQVCSWGSACGICGEWSGTGTGFSQSYSVFPCQYHSTMAFHTHISSGDEQKDHEWPQFKSIESLNPLTWITWTRVQARFLNTSQLHWSLIKPVLSQKMFVGNKLLTLWSRSASKQYLRIQHVPQREHHTLPLQQSIY
jgi:hypothetical protein